MDDDSAPGWEAIDAALATLYGEREPDRHMATVIKWMLGGPDPLDGISAYKVTDRGPPHWHLISYGLTELYSKQSDQQEWCGWGFELSTRLACDVDDEEPPVWIFNFLQNIARYVFSSGNVFAVGHHMDANGPIAAESDTALTALCFAPPPLLPAVVESPHGRFQILHLVGKERKLGAISCRSSYPCEGEQTEFITTMHSGKYRFGVLNVKEAHQ